MAAPMTCMIFRNGLKGWLRPGIVSVHFLCHTGLLWVVGMGAKPRSVRVSKTIQVPWKPQRGLSLGE